MLHVQSHLAEDISQLRAIACVFASLSYLQDEPLCRRCTSYVHAVEKSREKFLFIEKSLGKERNMPEEIRDLFLYIYRVLADLKIPGNTVRQKKQGQCSFPPGQCLAKNALKVYDLIEGQNN